MMDSVDNQLFYIYENAMINEVFQKWDEIALSHDLSNAEMLERICKWSGEDLAEFYEDYMEDNL